MWTIFTIYVFGCYAAYLLITIINLDLGPEVNKLNMRFMFLSWIFVFMIHKSIEDFKSQQ